MQLEPCKRQRGTWVDGERAAFGRLHVREEPEAALVEAAQQDVAGLRLPLGVHGRDRHRVRLETRRHDRVVDPLARLLDGIGIQVRNVDPARLVLAAQFRQVHGGRSSGCAGQAIVIAIGAEVPIALRSSAAVWAITWYWPPSGKPSVRVKVPSSAAPKRTSRSAANVPSACWTLTTSVSLGFTGTIE